MTETPTRSRLGPGCLGAAVVAIVAWLGLLGWWFLGGEAARKDAEEAQAAQAEAEFAPAKKRMLEAEQAGAAAYDIDRTIRVIHEIDGALAAETSMEDYLRTVGAQDYRGVAPEVLAARREVLEVLQRIWAKQVEAEERKAMWELTSELVLMTLSVVSVEGEANLVSPSGALAIDQAQAAKLLDQVRAEQAERRAAVRDLNELEGELFEKLLKWSEVQYKYVDEWDRLSLLRDRAWLATYNGDWPAAEAAAKAAMQQAPDEREAHLLYALARIESGLPEADAEVGVLLDDFAKKHPDGSAPALLLQGVRHARMGRENEARLAFQQSAAYYPRQSDRLLDMLDPYEQRAYLRKSREGSFIVEQYRGTMVGAGYFSPDLQMARLLFDQGDVEGAEAKVLDHFARRRAQQQWDFVLSDVRFCHELLGPRFWNLFPEDAWLDLQVSPTLLGGGLNLSVHNRSEKTLHNATLVLALHFTDTFPGDYEAIPVPGTQPALPAGQATSFGSVEIAVETPFGVKSVADVVTHRAILISNEAVTWVDTDQFKIAEAEAFQERRRAAKTKDVPVEPPVVRANPAFRTKVDEVFRAAPSKSSMKVEPRYGKDDVLIELPRELAILRPVFRLQRGNEVFTASDNLIEGDHIALRFKGVADLEQAASDDALELVIASPFGDVVLDWTPGGDLTWRMKGYERDSL